MVMKPMSAADILREIEARQISLVPALGLWSASVDECGDTLLTKKRKIRSISATAPTPAEAVRALIEKIEAEAQEREAA